MLQNKLLGGDFGEEILAFDYAGRTKKDPQILPK
jgi:hypothetical protein